jgi:hypothetical protein
MAETQLHAEIAVEAIEVLQDWFADDPMTYVWGNLLVYYEEGNPQKHLDPDVFVVHGVSKTPRRENY